MLPLPSHRPEEIVRLGEKIGFRQLVSQYELSDSDIRSIDKRLDPVDWCGLALYQKLSLSTIDRYKDKLCWLFVKQKQKHIDAGTLGLIEVEAYLEQDEDEKEEE